jgi:hypothetical protein
MLYVEQLEIHPLSTGACLYYMTLTAFATNTVSTETLHTVASSAVGDTRPSLEHTQPFMILSRPF